MAKKWADGRAEARVTCRFDEARIAALHREMLAELRAHRLAKIQESVGLNQTDLASRPGVSQSRVSRIERGDLDRTELVTSAPTSAPSAANWRSSPSSGTSALR
jgi:ribosome-binding protein aMBF1 (putative translation factor)